MGGGTSSAASSAVPCGTGRQNLGADLGFFAELVPTVVELMGDTFPELRTNQVHVTAVIREEEESFSKTLDKGLIKFKVMADTNVGEDKVFSGADAHFLYTSMGFPVDLTELMAEELGMTVDRDAFDVKMRQEQELSAAAHRDKMMGGSGKDMRLVAEQTAHLVGRGVEATDDAAKYVWNADLAGCTARALFIGRNETDDGIGFVDAITSRSGSVGIVLDRTSFYAEAGGQIYDTGIITTTGGGGGGVPPSGLTTSRATDSTSSIWGRLPRGPSRPEMPSRAASTTTGVPPSPPTIP